MFTRTKHRSNRLADYLHEPGGVQRADPRQPVAGAAHRGAGGVQVRAIPVPRGDGHRGSRDRRRAAGARGELRRAAPAGGLHPSGGPDGARRRDRGRVHLRVAGRGAGPGGDRAGDRQAAARGWSCPGSTTRASRQQRFEVPIAERIAEIRARKAEERRRAKEKAERRAANAAGGGRSLRARRAPLGRASCAARPGAERRRRAEARGRDAAPTRPSRRSRAGGQGGGGGAFWSIGWAVSLDDAPAEPMLERHDKVAHQVIRQSQHFQHFSAVSQIFLALVHALFAPGMAMWLREVEVSRLGVC